LLLFENAAPHRRRDGATATTPAGGDGPLTHQADRTAAKVSVAAEDLDGFYAYSRKHRRDQLADALGKLVHPSDAL